MCQSSFTYAKAIGILIIEVELQRSHLKNDREGSFNALAT